MDGVVGKANRGAHARRCHLRMVCRVSRAITSKINNTCDLDGRATTQGSSRTQLPPVDGVSRAITSNE